jgi:hypothetical protein
MVELLGRDRELADLRGRLAAATRGHGSFVVLRGEAGLGKTTLAEAAVAEAIGLGFRVFVGRAVESGETPPWFPVRTALRALGVTAIWTNTEVDVYGLWEAALDGLTREAGRRPVLWVVEDLHAADRHTVELLAFLARPLQALAAVVLATVRAGDPRAAVAAKERLVRQAAVIDLAPLAPGDVQRLATRVAGGPLVGSVETWMARTGGNPLFVVECARAVRSGSAVERALPGSLVDSVNDRLAALPEVTRTTLEAAAVLGREFTAAMLARPYARLPAEVIDGLLPALRARLVDEINPGSFHFVHDLVHAAITASLPLPRRRPLHARALAALEAEPDTMQVHLARAHHAIAALGEVDEDRVAGMVGAALSAALAESAHDRAFALWGRWLDARATVPDGEDWLRLAELGFAADQHKLAVDAALRAEALARRDADSHLLGRAALAAGRSAHPGMVDRSLVQRLEGAIAALPVARDPALAVRLRARLAAALQPSREPAVPLALAREAVATARALGDADVLREVLVHAGTALTWFVGAAEAHALAGELLSASLAAEDVPLALRAYVRRAIGDVDLGDLDAFDADVDAMIALARRAGHPALTWRPCIVASMRALARGDFAESERFVTEVEQAASLTDDPALLQCLRAHRTTRVATLDDEAQIRRVFAEEVRHLERAAGEFFPIAVALFAVRLEDPALVAPHLATLVGMASRLPPDSAALGGIAEAVALAGSLAQREELAGRIRLLGGRHAHTAPIPQTYEGPMSRVIGLVEASLGHHDAALVHLDAAAKLVRERSFLPWVARLGLERGRVLRALGREGEARAAFEIAVDVAGRLGMTGVLGRARRELGATSPVPPPLSTDRRVLAREGEVWRVTWGTRTTRVRDSRGLQLLARLVDAPGQAIHALALAGDAEEPLPETSAGEALDAAAIAAYRARLARIGDDLDEARERGDDRRLEGLERERTLLVAELSRAVGLGGRVRSVGSATERARVNVTRRLKDAVTRIQVADAEIGRHLDGAVRTGTYCSYAERGVPSRGTPGG